MLLPYNNPQITCIFLVFTQSYRTILCHAIENTVANTLKCDIHVVHDGEVGCNTVKYASAFLYCNWLYFLWCAIRYKIIISIAKFIL